MGYGTGKTTSLVVSARSSRGRLLLAALFILLVLGWSPAAQAAPGDIDRSFSRDGKVTTNFGPGSERADALIAQRDGKLVAAGTADGTGPDDYGDFALARYKPDGALDKSFGEGGKVITDLGNTDGANALILQPDGKLVVAGYTLNDGGFGDFALARYNPDGVLDQSFGEDGTVVTDTGGAFNYYDEALALIVQGDGKLVAAGYSDPESDLEDAEGDLVLARYNLDGSLDESFDGDGKAFTDVRGDDVAHDLVVLPDDGLVAAGTSYEGDKDRSAGDFALVRYKPNGALDEGFGLGGKVVTGNNGSSQAAALVLQPGGELVVAGTADNGAGTYDDFALVRYKPNGALDESFGQGGRVVTDLGRQDFDFASDLALHSDGSLVVAGASYNPESVFALARYRPDGALDRSFSGDGKVLTNIRKGYDSALALAVQSDGKLVAAGSSERCDRDFDECYDSFALARYKT